ncbi:nucleoside deaminase [Gallaecimonas xiamenensis]|uniref:Zinc-binding CMP/dCMP deaminase n=1 Tax=Gallaecimonas xiamenensis 3-C-1 TaxID=745411 RepID=K2K8Q5_9GAMM|nr:nucleoside deaminase [Gallaecimonas xiamenensis]EKE73645.1 zinc-binding CMP/dCMP deaminase [Gallaecimonas xiamenensis 3-C-1]
MDLATALRPPSTALELQLPHWVLPSLDWDKSYPDDKSKMALAISLARENVARQTGGPFGAAIFSEVDGRLLGVGVNAVVTNHNSCLHAEVMAIMMAQNRQQHFSLAEQDCALFSSCEPCAMCLGATLWSGVKRMVCAASGDDARAIGFDEGPVFYESYRYLERAGVRIQRGLMRTEGKGVLDAYQAKGGPIYNP